VAAQFVISTKCRIAKVAAENVVVVLLFRGFWANDKWSFFPIFRRDFGHIDLESVNDI
jgi:hypothetical protein